MCQNDTMFDSGDKVYELFLLVRKYPHKKFVIAPARRRDPGGYLWCAKCKVPKDGAALRPCLPHKWGDVVLVDPDGYRFYSCKLCGISNSGSAGRFCVEPGKNSTE